MLWCQVGVEHVAAIEFGGFCLRVLIASQGHGAPRYGQFDPVSDAQVFGAAHERVPRPLWIGTRMVCEVSVLLGDERDRVLGGPKVFELPLRRSARRSASISASEQ